MIPVRIELKNVIEILGTNRSDIHTIKPLTTMINNPRVNKIAGSANITRNGFNTEFTIENISPANKNPIMLALTWTLL
jgi:hypothetical protein